jgi:DNA-binding NtrC family response regulator
MEQMPGSRGGEGIPGPPGLVLVVDDEPLIRRVVGRILRGDGHHVALAGSLPEILETLGDARLSVVLLDLVLDRVDGIDVLDRVKRERPDVEVVVMTGHASVESAVDCMQRGAFDYLTKPFRDLSRVRVAVRDAKARALGFAPATSTEREPTTASDGSGFDAERDVPLSLDSYEKLALERALRESGGDVGAAAARLGIGRSTFYRKAAKHRMELQVGPSAAPSVGRGHPARRLLGVGWMPPIG